MAFGSPAQGKAHPRLRRTLRREVFFRPFSEDEDMPFMWAAYRKGVPEWPDGMDRDAFDESFAGYAEASDALLTLFAPNTKGAMPVGLARAAVNGKRVEPHFLWMPWASPRNRIESAVNFVNELRRTRVTAEGDERGQYYKVLIYADAPSRPFWDHLKRYGLLKGGFKIERMVGDVDYFVYFSREMD